jgi:cell wall-associated NlpC family hydrolase
MTTGVTDTASARRLALWKRVAMLPLALAATALAAMALAAMALSAQPAHAATDTQSPPRPHLMWARELAYRWAQTQAGAPYRYGGQGDGGYDCSGLVRTAYRQAGIWLPRTTGEMLQYRRLDQEASPRQGDLVFFGTGHVELYAGPDRSFGAETNRTGTWWNRWWPGSWWPTAFYRVSGAG